MTWFDYIGLRLILLEHIGHLATHAHIKYYLISFDYIGQDLTMLQPALPALSSSIELHCFARFLLLQESKTFFASFVLP